MCCRLADRNQGSKKSLRRNGGAGGRVRCGSAETGLQTAGWMRNLNTGNSNRGVTFHYAGSVLKICSWLWLMPIGTDGGEGRRVQDEESSGKKSMGFISRLGLCKGGFTSGSIWSIAEFKNGGSAFFWPGRFFFDCFCCGGGLGCLCGGGCLQRKKGKHGRKETRGVLGFVVRFCWVKLMRNAWFESMVVVKKV